MVKYREVEEDLDVEESATPFFVTLISRIFWMIAGFFSFKRLYNFPPYRPSLLFYAQLCYILILLLSIFSAVYLRLWIGGVPYRRWRQYIPIPIYSISGLFGLGFFLMIFTFGISISSIFYMSISNLGLLSLLSFF
jgi:hypothetical protein